MYTAKFTGVSIFAGYLHYAILDPEGKDICTIAVLDRDGPIERDGTKVPEVAALLNHLNRQAKEGA